MEMELRKSEWCVECCRENESGALSYMAIRKRVFEQCEKGREKEIERE